MNKFEQLAKLMCPDVTLTIKDLEEKYPARNLSEGARVTRFAPSPTGFLHTGSLFASFVAAKLAHDTDGIFYLRIEDTDTKREVKGSTETLISQLNTFNVTIDEGYSFGGNYGPYMQSERSFIYNTVIYEMVLKGLAYPCFCSAADLEATRVIQTANKERPGYYGKYAKCAALTVDEAIERIQNGEAYVVRFRSNGNFDNKFEFDDLRQGKLFLNENDIDEVTKQVDELKEQTQNTSEIQTDIDDIISSTQNLADKKQEILQNVDKAEEIDSAFTYNQSDDLFSIFSNYSSCKETVENDTVKQNVEQNVEQNNEITDNQIEEDLVTAQDENNVFEEINEEEINEEELYFDDINDKEAKDVVDNNLQDEQLDLFSFINTQQEQKIEDQDIEDQDEEIFDGVDEDDYNDIIKNFTTYQNTEQEITDQTELTIKQENELRDYVREILIIYWNISMSYNIFDAQEMKDLINNTKRDNLDVRVQLFIKYMRTPPKQYSELYNQIRSEFLNKNYSVLSNKNIM